METSAPGFRHELLLHHGDAEFLDGMVPYVQEGLSAGEPVMVALAPRYRALLQDALGRDARDVQWADMAVIGRNPGRIIPAWQAFVDQHGGRTVRGIGQPVWAGRTAEELAECVLHESLIDFAFDSGPAWSLICPYDTATLPPTVIDAARRTHPVDPRFEPEPLPPAPPHTKWLDFQAGDLPAVRSAVAACARAARLPGYRADDLVLAVHELATNSIRHGGGQGELRLWLADGAVVCEVSDAGHVKDPLAGRHLPPFAREGGRGLWLAHQLCDLVQLRTSAEGTVVRVRVGG